MSIGTFIGQSLGDVGEISLSIETYNLALTCLDRKALEYGKAFPTTFFINP